MKFPISVLAAGLIAASTSLYAQAPKGNERPGGAPRFDCSQAKDAKACEERREKMKSAMKKAHQACEGKSGTERRSCMQEQMCAQAKDPAKCNAEAKERQARRQQMREDCKDKQGDERKSCYREHMKEGKK